MVGMVRFTQWPASIPNALALLASKSLSLRWREEPVEVEGQGVELLIPAVASERPEPRPPWHPPVPRRIPHLQGVVEDHRDDQTDGRGRGEDGVDVVIELPHTTQRKEKKNDHEVYKFQNTTSEKKFSFSGHTHPALVCAGPCRALMV